ncbi:hypothetical protein FS749_007157 [Ceratobasidium sp. UAMH 11750]|nr:hypothetical protein FS749_007157 [Ceratobasidium sp. UAMH 11750]
MFVTKLILAAISALSAVYIASAMPTGLTPREDWKDALGWDGKCVNVGPDFNDNVSSFGPDNGWTCTIYSNVGCNGRATGGVIYPGIYNLADYNNNDAMSSFQCAQ